MAAGDHLALACSVGCLTSHSQAVGRRPSPGHPHIVSTPELAPQLGCDSVCIYEILQWLPQSTTIIEKTENNHWQKSPYLRQTSFRNSQGFVKSPGQTDHRSPTKE